ARAGGRRSARASFGDELEAVGDISDLPALVLDLAAQAVCLVEIAACPCLLPLLRKRDEGRGRRDRLGKVAEPEQLETPAQGRASATSSPVVEQRKGVRRVEVIVEDAGERAALDLLGFGLEADEVIAERLGLRARLHQDVVAEVDRLAPVGGHEVEQDRLAAPLLHR